MVRVTNEKALAAAIKARAEEITIDLTTTADAELIGANVTIPINALAVAPHIAAVLAALHDEYDVVEQNHNRVVLKRR